MQKKFFTDCVDIVGSACKQYDGEKNYISTGAVDVDYIVPSEVEQFDYINRPSRANLEVNKGDILFAKMQGTKKTLLINELLAQNVYSTGFCAVRPKDGILIERCLYHLVSSEIFLLQKDKNCSGATQKAITNAGLGKIMIKVPEYDSQEMLADELDKLAKIIKRRKSQLEKMDELIKARFVELFGDPVCNPKGWEKTALSHEAEIKIGPFGSLLHKEDYITGGHALINPSHIIEGKIAPDNALTVSDEKYAELAAYQLKEGDVVLGRRGEMGRCAVVDRPGLLCGTGSLMIRSKGDLSADYIQKIISFPSFKRTIEDMAVGQTMPNLNVPIVSDFQIIKPPKKVQDEYYTFVEQVDKSKVVVQKALDEAQLLFDSLMQEYFG